MSLDHFRPKYYSLPPSARSLSLPPPSSGRQPSPFVPPSPRSLYCLPPFNSNNFSDSKWFQIRKLSTIKLYNLSRSTTSVLVIFLYDFVWTVWIWISNYDNFKQYLQVLKWFQLKKTSTTKWYNSSRSINFILVISSSDKVICNIVHKM